MVFADLRIKGWPRWVDERSKRMDKKGGRL
jgi:hypothetical protein